MFKIISLLTVLGITCGVKLPSIFQKCNRSQADFQECLPKAVENGLLSLEQPLQDFRFPNINPLEIPELIISGKGVVAVEQKFKNCKLYGLTKMKVDDFRYDFEKKTLHLSGVFPQIQKKCDYELDGKVLLLPIKGTGASTITLENLKIDQALNFDEIKKNHKTYIHMKDGNLKLNPGKISFNFENLFNGDKTLGDNINQVLNDNHVEVFKEMKESYEQFLDKIIVDVFNIFYSKVSIEEAFD